MRETLIALLSQGTIPGCRFSPILEVARQVLGNTMAETTKLSVEKALEKLRRSDSPKSKNARLDDKIDTLGGDKAYESAETAPRSASPQARLSLPLKLSSKLDCEFLACGQREGSGGFRPCICQAGRLLPGASLRMQLEVAQLEPRETELP
jgi:hypothetical protein